MSLLFATLKFSSECPGDLEAIVDAQESNNTARLMIQCDLGWSDKMFKMHVFYINTIPILPIIKPDT